jgi:hypothetical protein
MVAVDARGCLCSLFMRGRFAVLLGFCALLAAKPALVRADDQRLVLMREPISYTDVIDAFDADDAFDLNAQLSYQRTIDRGEVLREQTSEAGPRRSKVAESRRVLSQLMLEVDVGLYKDLMAFVRVPLVLSDDRSLRMPSGRSGTQAAELLSDPLDFAGSDGSLFGVPLDAPTRAGFDYLALGGAVALTSQERKPWLPTWVLAVEGRRAVGGLLRPCRIDADADGATRCGAFSPEDIDGDGQLDGTTESMGDESGASRGVSAFALDMRVSKRFRFVEPYAGLGALIEWASSARKYFEPGGQLKGYGETAPSRQASATLGAELIPWEHRGRHQRVGIDVRLSGTYLTRGRDYSALYDALGTSGHAALARPQFEGVQDVDQPGATQLEPCAGAGDTNCYVGKKVSFYGLTDLGPRLKYGARLSLDVRAARYVRFMFGTGVSWVTDHLLTAAEACNADARDASRSEGYYGTSCGSHASNPAYRASIDAPGRRFWMSGELLVDIFAAATAQF